MTPPDPAVEAQEVVKLIERTLELDAKATEGPWHCLDEIAIDHGKQHPKLYTFEVRECDAKPTDKHHFPERICVSPSGVYGRGPSTNAALIAEYRTAAPALALHLQAALSTIEKLTFLQKELEVADAALLVVYRAFWPWLKHGAVSEEEWSQIMDKLNTGIHCARARERVRQIVADMPDQVREAFDSGLVDEIGQDIEAARSRQEGK